ncbi:ectoine hydroxylase-related dioxygenase (phytanoyl-CoA dioxygenase family) [Rubellimicrobium aerolatum]|nr:phytanoyl-CoA dioxygenase family protein [Rubellimicrobium aerolatum]MBP1806691.1 ectoine hydroxylase-related dioxygenase (phytanoyl-CoA dioxygenase family) [Rubellimicrobium aerolatum]
MAEYPEHIHAMGPTLILQGSVAHCDMPVESGTTKLLPHSQRYLPGYVAATRPEFRDHFEARCIQLPLEKGTRSSSRRRCSTRRARTGRRTWCGW